jgi:hypothetical protein
MLLFLQWRNVGLPASFSIHYYSTLQFFIGPRIISVYRPLHIVSSYYLFLNFCSSRLNKQKQAIMPTRPTTKTISSPLSRQGSPAPKKYDSHSGSPAPSRPLATKTSNVGGKATVPNPEQFLPLLDVGGFYIVMYCRTQQLKKDDFHWGLYHHHDARGGMKYHVINSQDNVHFKPDHAMTAGVFKSASLCVLIKFGQIPPKIKPARDMDAICKSFDNSLTAPGTTCRTWSMKVIQKGVKSGIIECSDVKTLEQECKDTANGYQASTLKGELPRPIVKSRFCRNLTPF